MLFLDSFPLLSSLTVVGVDEIGAFLPLLPLCLPKPSPVEVDP